MEQKLLYIFIISILLDICTLSTQVSFTCNKKEKAAILLDTANDFITRAKYTNLTCSYDVYNGIRREKSSSLLETATNLISSAKNTCEEPPLKAELNTGAKAKYAVVCNFANWAYYRNGDGKFEISHIDPNLCTHIVYYWAEFRNNQIEPYNPGLDLDSTGRLGGYNMCNALKHKNPNLKTLLVVSGADQFPIMAADQTSRTAFVSNVILFLKKYGFDGLSLWWLYPKKNEKFLQLLQDLKAAMNPQGLLLSVPAPSRKQWVEEAQDIPAAFKELDLVYLLTDKYRPDKSETSTTSPLYHSEDNEDNIVSVNSSVNYWLKSGAVKEKLVLALWMIGKSYILADTTQHGLRAPITGPGPKGPLLGDSDGLGFNEICLNIAKEGWNSVYDWESRTSYAYKGDQWVSYNDIYNFHNKIDYVIEKGLAGVSLSIDNDDFRGNCYGRKYPILNTLASRLLTCKGKD